MSIIFERKLTYNKGSLQMNIPKEIVSALKLERGEILEITFENGSFLCRKKQE